MRVRGWCVLAPRRVLVEVEKKSRAHSAEPPAEIQRPVFRDYFRPTSRSRALFLTLQTEDLHDEDSRPLQKISRPGK